MPIIDVLVVNTVATLLFVTLQESALIMESSSINSGDSHILSKLASVLAFDMAYSSCNEIAKL